MPLKTVRAPPELAPLFERAEEIVSRYFADQRSDPEHGTIEIHGERYILVRAAALSVEFFALVEGLYGPGREGEAEAFARSILFDLAHAVGKSDARSFHARMGLVNPVERLSAGPVHFAYTGWARVDVSPESLPVAGEGYHTVFDHPYSFESDAWIQAGQRRQRPACIMNAGYASGWAEASFGFELVAVEVLCRARGDEACRFIMAPPSRIEAHVERFHALRPAPGPLAVPDFFSRKRMEEELRQAHDELERRVEERTAELTRANERLRREIVERERAEARLLQTQELEAVGRLAGGIAHDFNNLIAIVSANCDLLRRRLGSADPAATYLEDIATASARAAELTQQLLAFYLPRASAPASVPDPSPVPGPAAAAATILVVEDQPRLRDVIGLVLTSFGYDAILARDAADAVRLAEEHPGPIHVLLTDVVMPRTSGPLLAERIRALRPETRVVFMSGYAPDAMRQYGGLAGDTPLLQKPFGPDALERAMRSALGPR